MLLARIRAQLRQYEAGEDSEFKVGPYLFRPTSKNLINAQGLKLRLTEKEAAILRFLHRADQQPVARENSSEARLGLQFERHYPHARNAHLPSQAEDRGQSGGRAAPRDRGRRL